MMNGVATPKIIHIKCSCGMRLRVPSDKLGKRGRCPECGCTLRISSPLKVPALLPDRETTPERPPRRRAAPPARHRRRAAPETAEPSAGKTVVAFFNGFFGVVGMVACALQLVGLVRLLSDLGASGPIPEGMATLLAMMLTVILLSGAGCVCMVMSAYHACWLRPGKVRDWSFWALLLPGVGVAMLLLNGMVNMAGAASSMGASGAGLMGLGVLALLVVGLLGLSWPLTQYLLNRLVLFPRPAATPRRAGRGRPAAVRA